MKLSVVIDTDNISGNSVGHKDTVVGHKGQSVRNLHILLFTNVVDLHAGFVLAGADAEERDAVTMFRIHIGLNLEDEAAEFGFIRFNHAFAGITRLRSRSPANERVQDVLHTEVIDTGAEEDRRLVTGKETFQGERFTSALNELDAFSDVPDFQREQLIEPRVIQSLNNFDIVAKFLAARSETDKLIVQKREHTSESFSHSNRPCNRGTLDFEDVFNFSEQIDRVLDLAVQFIDERNNRSFTQTANFQKFNCLRLHALGGIDNHDCAVNGGQYSIGIFREVLMSRGIEKIDYVIVVLKLHNGAGDGNTALFFNFHPVARCMTAGFTSLDRTCELNCSAEKKQLFGKSCFTSVRVRNNREGSSAFNLFLRLRAQLRHFVVLFIDKSRILRQFSKSSIIAPTELFIFVTGKEEKNVLNVIVKTLLIRMYGASI